MSRARGPLRRTAAWGVLGGLLAASSGWGAEPVPDGYRAVAARHGIPERLFYAVALAESGYRVDSSGAARPWPWTLNVAGSGAFYPSRAAALTALREALAQGRTSVDVGLMQVNWKYHRERLAPVEAALDPYRNLDIGAGILLDCYRSAGAWWAAVGCYHAPNEPGRAAAYRARVRALWSALDPGS